MVKIFVLRERVEGETRVAAMPDSVRRLVKKGLAVHVESGAGLGSHVTDEAFTSAGATVGDAAWADADVVVGVRHIDADAVKRMKEGAVLIGLLDPYQHLDTVQLLADRKISALPMELVPRVTRAQTMDALSSQASIAGYKAVVLAAATLGKYFPLMMTAAGTIKPARVVVMGAGVAGLQAIATAKRLGAIVEVSDIRAEVKEQVESLGGRFIDLPDMQTGTEAGGYAREVTKEFLDKQRAIVAEKIAQADVVITTAQVPGKRAPTLVTEAMVKSMKPGSVIVDIAVAQGGNCEISPPKGEVVKHGVHIIGHPNLPATMPNDASALYARNVLDLLGLIVNKEGVIAIDLEDEVIAGTLMTHAGEIRHPGIADAVKGTRA